MLSCSFNLNLNFNLPSHVALHFCVWYVLRLAKTNTFDYILIEASGVAEPLPIAETFTFDDEVDGLPVKDLAMVDTMVTVVDAFNFLKDFKGADTLEFRKLAGTLMLQVTALGPVRGRPTDEWTRSKVEVVAFAFFESCTYSGLQVGLAPCLWCLAPTGVIFHEVT